MTRTRVNSAWKCMWQRGLACGTTIFAISTCLTPAKRLKVSYFPNQSKPMQCEQLRSNRIWPYKWDEFKWETESVNCDGRQLVVLIRVLPLHRLCYWQLFVLAKWRLFNGTRGNYSYSDASIPLRQWCISLCFRFPPISEKFFGRRGKFLQFDIFP